ncbi:MAG: hypothetical protein K2O71_06315 [Lachnospiraceae bacterium]|nr:hypothetical protein [Lachnospiraceae bacterium]
MGELPLPFPFLPSWKSPLDKLFDYGQIKYFSSSAAPFSFLNFRVAAKHFVWHKSNLKSNERRYFITHIEKPEKYKGSEFFDHELTAIKEKKHKSDLSKKQEKIFLPKKAKPLRHWETQKIHGKSLTMN